ncbi:MAG: ribosome maturation factor RimM, partial [Bacteroidota bacterium]
MNLINVGKFNRTHGFKGMLVISPNVDVKVDWESVETILYGTEENALIPGFIEEISKSKDKVFIKIESISNKELAVNLLGLNVYCEGKFVQENQSDIKIGYVVHDLNFGLLGEVFDVQQLPGQEIIFVKHTNGKEIL